MTDYRCLLHPERPAEFDPQGLLICGECNMQYRDERARNLPFVGRVFLRRLIAVRHELERRSDGN